MRSICLQITTDCFPNTKKNILFFLSVTLPGRRKHTLRVSCGRGTAVCACASLWNTLPLHNWQRNLSRIPVTFSAGLPHRLLTRVNFCSFKCQKNLYVSVIAQMINLLKTFIVIIPVNQGGHTCTRVPRGPKFSMQDVVLSLNLCCGLYRFWLFSQLHTNTHTLYASVVSVLWLLSPLLSFPVRRGREVLIHNPYICAELQSIHQSVCEWAQNWKSNTKQKLQDNSCMETSNMIY